MTTLSININPARFTPDHRIPGASARLYHALDVSPAPPAIRERRRYPDVTPASGAAPGRALHRPDGSVLHESFPVYFVGRNRDGFWVARDADGRVGGLFLFERSAMAFAHSNSTPDRCAIVLPSERFELEVANHGNRLISLIGFIKRLTGRRVS
jgi:hypothetical protein